MSRPFTLKIFPKQIHYISLNRVVAPNTVLKYCPHFNRPAGHLQILHGKNNIRTISYNHKHFNSTLFSNVKTRDSVHVFYNTNSQSVNIKGNSQGSNNCRPFTPLAPSLNSSVKSYHSDYFRLKDAILYGVAFAFAMLGIYFLNDDEYPFGVKVGYCASSHDPCQKTTTVKENPIKHKSKFHKEVQTTHMENKTDFKRNYISLQAAIDEAKILCRRKKLELGTPGLVVCVSVDGKQVYAEGFGYADMENEVPIQPNSVLRIASISKSVTSVILAKLWEQGKLDLEKRVQHYVPTFPEKYFLGEKVDMTVEQVLNHTSGIRHYKREEDPVYAFDEPIKQLVGGLDITSMLPFYASGPFKKVNLQKSAKIVPGKSTEQTPHLGQKEYFIMRNFATTADSLKLFQDDALLCKPGSKYNYSSHGFTLLAAVAESVTNRVFTDLITQTFAHMGLSQSYLDQNTPIIYNRARYYMKNKEGDVINVPYVDNSYKWAGGGMLSTVEDLVKFGNILLYSAQHNDKDPGPPGYLKASTVWKFWSSPKNSPIPRYGLGFELRPDRKHYGMCDRWTFGAGHTGNAVGASSILFVLPRHTTLSEDRRMDNSLNPDNNLNSSQMNQEYGASQHNVHSGLPQGVVVAIIVNITGVGLRSLAHSIANTFENVDFTL